MVEGINYITDAKGNETGVILDFIAFRKNKVNASDVISALSGLQELIDKAIINEKKVNNWDLAKNQLKELKTKIDQ